MKINTSVFFSICLMLVISACHQPGQVATGSKLAANDTLKFSSGIRAILHDSKGNYWFASNQEGIALYDGQSYRYFTTADGLADNQVRSIQEDEKGRIWFGTARGVDYYADGVIHHQPVASDGNWDISEQDLWFNAGNSPGVYRYHDGQLDYLVFPLTWRSKEHAGYQVTDIAKGKENRIWISTYGSVFGYDGKGFTIYNDQTLKHDQRSGFIHARSVLEDSKGRLWMGNNGIGVLVKEGDSVYNFSEKHNLIQVMSPRTGAKSVNGTMEHVFAIAEDKLGGMWFGDRDNGVWHFDNDSLQNYTVNPKLSNKMVWCIYRDRSENILFGMAAGGVYRFVESGFERVF
ncbi:MAG: diguanylate cyclase [Bacteroidetes bacterium]|nr:MAG: diguanylate cyclase [Bacteroidota bacterium]